MDTNKENLIHYRIAARRYGLPPKWLREQAQAGNIPALIADGQVLFDTAILSEWLAKRAREGSNDGK
ncbi:MAG: glutathione S-transferase domain-containing protein [Sedimentisphaerales bacterium]|nr:glutathione S-transferase domain-containing protein [Sedimentisphaerales bacterium]